MGHRDRDNQKKKQVSHQEEAETVLGGRARLLAELADLLLLKKSL
jgi:hypothetical protein